jgi:hypothetical protein
MFFYQRSLTKIIKQFRYKSFKSKTNNDSPKSAFYVYYFTENRHVSYHFNHKKIKNLSTYSFICVILFDFVTNPF